MLPPALLPLPPRRCPPLSPADDGATPLLILPRYDAAIFATRHAVFAIAFIAATTMSPARDAAAATDYY